MPDNDFKQFSTLDLFLLFFLLYKLVTKTLHLATIFLRLVTKRRLKVFFNFEPFTGNYINYNNYAITQCQFGGNSNPSHLHGLKLFYYRTRHNTMGTIVIQ